MHDIIFLLLMCEQSAAFASHMIQSFVSGDMPVCALSKLGDFGPNRDEFFRVETGVIIKPVNHEKVTGNTWRRSY